MALMLTTKQIIGDSKKIKLLREMLSRVAATNATVLIGGESGTGKELVAKAIHELSPRAAAAFVPINCAAIPKDLLESELFGHRRGAFSGAIADRKGRFELADGGTLFLDEVGDMPPDMQVKLLRVLQEGVIDPVGGHAQVAIDVRVVAATHCDLEAECAAGRFREDLFYRLNVIPVKVPPLRERVEDIARLIEHFAQMHAQDGARPIALESCLAGAMHAYAWPGNIRELSNLIFRLSVLYSGRRLGLHSVSREMLPTKMDVGLVTELRSDKDDDLAAEAREDDLLVSSIGMRPLERNPIEDIIFVANGGAMLPEGGLALKDYLNDIERNIIEQALSRSGGNVSKTAQLLQLQRTTLIQKLNKLKRNGDAPTSAGDAGDFQNMA